MKKGNEFLLVLIGLLIASIFITVISVYHLTRDDFGVQKLIIKDSNDSSSSETYQ